MIDRARLLLTMVRFRVAVTMWTFMVLGVARHASPRLTGDLVAATVALAASYAVATSLNDVADIEIDRLNRPRDASRPLVAGTATVADLRWTTGLATGIAVVAAVPLGAIGAAVVLVSVLLSYAYSVGPTRFSRRMVLAPVVLTLAYVAVPYALGVTVAGGRLDGRDAPFVAGLLALFFARIILKDFRDRLGDEAFGKPTLLFRLGRSATCAISIAGAVLGTTLLLVAVAPSDPVMLVLAVELAGIVWMLVRLRDTPDPRMEQVAIGTAARAGNALLIAILAWLVLSADGASTATIALFEAGLGAVFAVSFLSLALHPERVRIGYKA